MKKTLGRYEILGILGRGSMGVVYKGIDPQIKKLVAIKTMNQKLLSQPVMQERFYREGAILGKLTHRNIISVYTVGEDGDICYIAMEYLEGTSLDVILKNNLLIHPRRTLEIICQVCDGVQAAHQHGVIHRDIKPANVFLLEEDHVKVLDFGVAHFQDSRLTNSGMLLGTVNYMAPEQITGDGVDHRSDIFSTGVILYQLLCGKNPFIGTNISQTMMRIVNHEPEPIEGLDIRLQTVLDKALTKNKDTRFQSVKDFAKALRQVLKQSDFEPMGEESLPDSPTSFNEIITDLALDNHAEKTSQIRDLIRLGKLEEAKVLIQQFREEDPTATQLESLEKELAEVRNVQEQKRDFLKQLTQQTLIKANDHMSQRHYVSAIELCDKVLRHSPDSQDARVIKAASVNKLKRFLEQVTQ